MTAAPPVPGPRVVALGGGHGLAASLLALRQVTDRLTAVVTVADDGGSSGRLRSAYGVLPPGDLRMALAALAGEAPAARLLRDTLQHRFPAGASPAAEPGLAGHPVGNLLLAGLMQRTGDPVAALAAVAQLLELPPATRVLPMSCEPLDIAAEVGGLAPGGELVTVRGQVEVATTRGRVVAVHLLPPDPQPCPEALAALEEAEAVVLGPGSLFTSVLPHLLLPALRKAVTAAPGRRVLVLNLTPQRGETDGFSPESHLEVLGALVPELALDWVVADRSALAGWTGQAQGRLSPLITAAETLGARVHLDDLARKGRPGVHDADSLARALRAVLAAPGPGR